MNHRSVGSSGNRPLHVSRRRMGRLRWPIHDRRTRQTSGQTLLQTDQRDARHVVLRARRHRRNCRQTRSPGSHGGNRASHAWKSPGAGQTRSTRAVTGESARTITIHQTRSALESPGHRRGDTAFTHRFLDRSQERLARLANSNPTSVGWAPPTTGTTLVGSAHPTEIIMVGGAHPTG